MRHPAHGPARGVSVVNATAAREFPLLMLAIGLMLLFYGVVDAAVNAQAERVWRLAVSLVPSAVFLGLFAFSRSRWMTIAAAPRLTVAAIVAVMLGQATTIYLGRATSDLALLLVLWCVSGAAAVSGRQFALVTAGLLPTWVFTARLVVPGEGVMLAGDWTGAVLATIASATTVHMGRAASFREQQRMQDELAHLACSDALTGVASRYGATIGFEALRAKAARLRTPLFAVFVDVDGLKRMNDVHGHDAGDALIVAAGRAIAASTRAGDQVTRWGGDEFVVIGMGAGPDLVRLLGAIERRVNADMRERGLPTATVSLGVAACQPDLASIDTLVNQADADMYRRRRARRGELRVVRDTDRASASA